MRIAAHIGKGHSGEFISVSPFSGEPVETYWYCYTCDYAACDDDCEYCAIERRLDEEE